VIDAGRQVWMQVVEGTVEVNGRRLAEGDGAAIEEPGNPIVTGADDWSDVLLLSIA
jgi:redox-sensitive bicupin YhaK (pirin superfamily)